MASNVLLTDLASSGLKHIPSNYVRPESARPNLTEVETNDDSIPLIDLQGLDGLNDAEVIKQIGQACREYGFFQIKNHGVPSVVVDRMLQVTRGFFRLPVGERLKHYSNDPMKTTRLSTSFNISKEKVSSWRDYLMLNCLPLEDHVDEWPSNPPTFREVVAEYCEEIRGLVLRLLEEISKSMGLEKDHLRKSIGKHGQHMAMNYYPPCPEPELTYGLPGHKDGNVITILLQDDVPGLQVMKEGKWVAVNPIPNTLIVNIGDQMQVLSNDHYKSVLHRAVVNSTRERISIATFYCPSFDAIISPARELVDANHPPVYRRFTFQEFDEKFWDRGLNSVTCLDMFKTN